MAHLVLFIVVSAVATAAMADGTSSSSTACRMRKEELEDQSQSTLTLENPEAVQRCCDQILAAEPGCVRRVCPASLPDEVCPGVLWSVCPGHHDGSVNDATSSASSPRQQAPALLMELLSLAVACQIFRVLK
ncbi:unnamed protein product [Urochloa humidicola]